MSQTEARYTIRTLIATVVVTIAVTVISLEYNGRITHTDDKQAVEVGEFKAVHLAPDGDEIRMSPKPSELHAVCEQGYLAIASDTDPAFRAILLDYKSRGVRCGEVHALAAPGTTIINQEAEVSHD